MIKQKTIKDINEVYPKIDSCKEALDILRFPPNLDVRLSISTNKGNYTILINSNLAIELVERQLKLLEGEL